MAKNRKHQALAVRWGSLVRVVLLCLFCGGTGIGYVWQKKQIHALAGQIGRKEQYLLKLQEHNKAQLNLLESLRSPAVLEARIKELNLGLVMPQPNQILRLAEPAYRVASGWTPDRAPSASALVAR